MMESDGTKFYPSEIQRKLLEAVQEAGYAITITEACAKAGVPRRNWYNWGEHPEFIDWWNEQRERYWVRRLAEVDAAAFQAATGEKQRGSPADRRLLLERYDRAFKPQRRLETSGQIDYGKSAESLEELTESVLRILGEEKNAEAEAEDRKPEGEQDNE